MLRCGRLVAERGAVDELILFIVLLLVLLVLLLVRLLFPLKVGHLGRGHAVVVPEHVPARRGLGLGLGARARARTRRSLTWSVTPRVSVDVTSRCQFLAAELSIG